VSSTKKFTVDEANDTNEETKSAVGGASGREVSQELA